MTCTCAPDSVSARTESSGERGGESACSNVRKGAGKWSSSHAKPHPLFARNEPATQGMTVNPAPPLEGNREGGNRDRSEDTSKAIFPPIAFPRKWKDHALTLASENTSNHETTGTAAPSNCAGHHFPQCKGVLRRPPNRPQPLPQ